MANGAKPSSRAAKRPNYAITLRRQASPGSMKKRDLKSMRHRPITGNPREALSETSMRRVSPQFAKIYRPWMKKFWKTAKTGWLVRARRRTSECCLRFTRCSIVRARAWPSRRRARYARRRKRQWPILGLSRESQALWRSSREAREGARYRRSWERLRA